MRRRIGPIAVLAVGLGVTWHVAAQEPPANPATPATPAEQYQQLLKACEVRSPGRVLSDKERIQ